mmetsp:Transcript_7024/g.20636  ORF Transcript_7024/g.20636 Transcript_7024/m.20636 type:complete len:367 (-) Transcript_7024:25-1125(-)|eukprot:CAMPEP_0119269884 /NCGR_PEP_ID=MMETSP1329-20130426/7103_1 /TAXON_ID=114041 /ORGANISM="Genus nov. species nov., Strain RCC1024" /LENGTH=366 /DNA_ID=CAMNT_0007269887 /DNA_START=259 /DNA_END=1359 /DNA_ORIENTATION=+
MFKKRTKKGQAMKREREEAPAQPGAAAPAEDHAQIVKKQHKQARGSYFGKNHDEDADSDDEDRMQGAAVFASSRDTGPIEHRGGAFEYAEVDADASNDTRAQLEKSYALQREGEAGDGVYRGQANYKSFTRIDEARIGGNKYSGTKGPIRAPQFVRNTCRFDYQPDVCKDYKDTGFCGYGDSCKFMHDRGDYKTGWQLEAEFQRQKERQKEREMMGKLDGPDSDEERERDKYRVKPGEEDLPFACHFCRGPFTEPMMTTCGHYFNADCASKHFREKGTRCPICEKQTYGILNAAPKLRAKAKKMGGFEKMFEDGLRVPGDDDDGKPAEDPSNLAYGAPGQKPGAARPVAEDFTANGLWQSVDPRNL